MGRVVTLVCGGPKTITLCSLLGTPLSNTQAIKPALQVFREARENRAPGGGVCGAVTPLVRGHVRVQQRTVMKSPIAIRKAVF